MIIMDYALGVLSEVKMSKYYWSVWGFGLLGALVLEEVGLEGVGADNASGMLSLFLLSLYAGILATHLPSMLRPLPAASSVTF